MVIGFFVVNLFLAVIFEETIPSHVREMMNQQAEAAEARKQKE